MGVRWSLYRIKRIWDGVGTGLSGYEMEWVQDEVSMGWREYRIGLV